MAHILIIDDSASMRTFLEETLLGAGHSIQLADNGRQGLAQMRRQGFDLVITDIFMPETDGLETLRHARQAGVRTPMIAISAKDSIMNLLPAARLLGAQGTLQKPFTAAQLLALVAAVLAGEPGSATPTPGSPSTNLPPRAGSSSDRTIHPPSTQST